MYKDIFKRGIGLFIATCCIIMVSPILLILTGLLYIIYKGNPFFFQLRPGWKAHVFKAVKFKTMSDKRNASGELLTGLNMVVQAMPFRARL